MDAPASATVLPNAWAGKTGIQVYWRSFLDGNGDGIGDLQGLRSRLTHLVWLGIEVLWITPMMTSPQKDFGYDVSDYRDTDPLFGRREAFEAFLAEANSLGIRVVLDIACNHTSEDHPWFKDAISSPDSPYRSWFVFRQGKPNGDAPNKWLSIFGGPAWTPVRGEPGMWYLHTFGSFQPELDWHNAEVREEMLDIVRFWLDKGVSGFRLDAVTPIGKCRNLRDSPDNPLWTPDMDIRDLNTSMFAECQPDMDLYLAWFAREIAKSHPGAMLFPEAYVPDLATDLHAYDRFFTDPDITNSAPFNFALMFTKWSPKDVAACLGAFYAMLPDGALATWAISNHDRSRPATKMGRLQAFVAMALLLTLPGLPWLYMGQELNMVDGEVPDEYVQDPDGRDPERTPIRWSNEPHGGFTTGSPWLPVSDETVSVLDQSLDCCSPLMQVRRLIWLRHHNLALGLGRYVPADSTSDGVLIYGRAHGDDFVTVLLNLTDELQFVELSRFAGPVLFSSIIRDAPRGKHVELQPGEVLILEGSAS